MKQRSLKVYKAPGLDPDIPQIRIQGKWLSDLGYHVGDHMIVSIKSGKLIIEHAPAEPVKA